MKRNFSSILAIALLAIGMLSCGGDDPVPANVDTATNEKIQKVMQANYLWELPNNVNLNQGVETFYSSLLSPSDSYKGLDEKGNVVNYKYSYIYKANATFPVSYDPGFEYAINNYVSGVTYYVVLYVKPNTSASNYMMRGLYITKVNGEAVTSSNATTLLANAYKNGQKFEVTTMTPMVTEVNTFTIEPAQAKTEAPMFATSILSAGSKKVGYIAYNNFSSGTNYAHDNSLANQLANFQTQGVNTLVLDLRYNSGGSVYAAQSLGSALVKNRDTNKAFIQQMHRPSAEKPVQPLNFRDKTYGNVDIPKLGDNLDKIYIITGQSTAGAAEALVNALKAYRSDVEVVGEKTKGRTLATATASENGKDPGEWVMNLAYSHLADVNKKYDYANGLAPNTVIKDVEVAAKNQVLLGELGAENEIILSQILSKISGVKSVLSLETRSIGVDRPLKTSLGNRVGANETTVDLQ